MKAGSAGWCPVQQTACVGVQPEVYAMLAGVSGQAWATYLPAEKAPSDGSKPRGATVFARDFQTVIIYDAQGKFVGVRRPGSALPIQVCCCCNPCLPCDWQWQQVTCLVCMVAD